MDIYFLFFKQCIFHLDIFLIFDRSISSNAGDHSNREHTQPCNDTYELYCVYFFIRFHHLFDVFVFEKENEKSWHFYDYWSIYEASA